MIHINGYPVSADDDEARQAEVLKELETEDPALAKIVSRYYQGIAKDRKARRQRTLQDALYGVGIAVGASLFTLGFFWISTFI